MAPAFIQEKEAEERKREKRLVHLTNALSREFLNSQAVKTKTKSYKDNAVFITKSLLDYIFFNEHKEIKEINIQSVQHFMLDYAPRKLKLTTEGANDLTEIISSLLAFMETEGHINNSVELRKIVRDNKNSFLKLMPTPAKSTTKSTKDKPYKKNTGESETKVKAGRNDPCPCGSGKKYKKCCGKLT